MPPRPRSYHCTVCGWQGTAVPEDIGDSYPCPNCGQYVYPQSWAQSWGLALVLIGGTVGMITAFAYLR